MVYSMKVYVDGGCRRNGSPSSIGAAAAVIKREGSRNTYCVERLHENAYDPPTNQKAELMAIRIALKCALQQYRELDTNQRLDVEIFSDSTYAIRCVTEWVHWWSQNGWRNAAGNRVANQRLIQEASILDNDLRALGDVNYSWIPRSDNGEADYYANRAMDEMERDRNY